MDNYYKHYRYVHDGKTFTMFVGPDMPPHVWDGEKMCRLEPIDPNMTEIKLGTIRVSDIYDFEAMGANLKKDEEKSRGAAQDMCEAREISGVKSNTTVRGIDNAELHCDLSGNIFTKEGEIIAKTEWTNHAAPLTQYFNKGVKFRNAIRQYILAGDKNLPNFMLELMRIHQGEGQQHYIKHDGRIGTF